MDVWGQGAQEAHAAGQNGREGFCDVARQPIRSLQRSQVNVLGQLLNRCSPPDLYPQILPQPGAQFLDVNHTLPPLHLPPKLPSTRTKSYQCPLEVGR